MKMNKKGFTLIEIIIVAAIIGLMAFIGIPAILGGYSSAKENAKARNIADINKTKAQLTLPVGTSGGEGYTDSTAVDDTVKGKINNLLRIGSASDLAVGGMTPNYGSTIGDPAKY
ncbi:MAG: prepilin-type N-terminal cleavage/methylation domain-containing protein [Kiritimatiellales bacterium]